MSAYRLELGEPLSEGIARVARGRIDRALDELGGRTDSTPEQVAHETRKQLKKLRGLLRLARGELGEKTYRRENACFRDAARELAGLRDADALPATLATVEGVDVGPLHQALEAHRIRTTGGARAKAAAGVAQTLSAARERVDAWPLERHGFSALEDGLLRTYREGRRGWRDARREPTVEGIHEWRKRVKDHWYHLVLLECAWPPVLGPWAEEAHSLSSLLGEDHDLAALLGWSREHAPLEGLEQVVAERRSSLQARAFPLAAHVYGERPTRLARRTRRWWDASS
jgi:CHAD domain-containing protein